MVRAIKDKATGLTAKQEQFCLLYFETGNASAAYRAAYDAEKMSPAAVSQEAYVLLHNPEITLRLEKLRRELAERSMATKMEHVGELTRLRNMATEAGEWRAAVRAEEVRGKVLGWRVEKVESGRPGDFSHLSDEELAAELKAAHEAEALILRARKSPKPKVKVNKVPRAQD